MSNGIKPPVPDPSPDPDRKKGMVRRLWTMLRKPAVKYSVLSLLVIGFFSGIIFWGGFNTAMEATNEMEFCIGCHEMRDTVYEEYKKTVHYSNRTGVRAVCSDCHVPRAWTHKMVRKIQATGEIYGKVMGTINTPEKFEAKRLKLAENEWARMRATDSIECRNCHSFEGMSKEAQTSTAWRGHNKGRKNGETCIDCHMGIAHSLPEGITRPEDD